MEEEKIENIDSLNDGGVVNEQETETVETLKAKNQSLYERLKKAEGYERDDDGAWIKKPEPEVKPKTEPKTEPKAKKSDDFDYGQKAFLIANGIKGEKEINLVKEAMGESGKTLEQVLESKYFKTELDNLREINRSEQAVPQGRRTSNNSADNVEYWMSKPMSEVPKEMRAKVVNAKLAKENGGGVFYNS